MDWFSVDDATFFAACWLAAFFTSLALSFTETHYRTLKVSVANAWCVGTLAFTVVAILVGREPEDVTGHWHFIGIAAAVGLAGPAFQRRIIEKLLSRFVDAKQPTEDTTKPTSRVGNDGADDE